MVTMRNGVEWPQMCIDKTEAHFFGIGDWGGSGSPPVPMPNLKGRTLVKGIDDKAQLLVARQMNSVSATSQPDYVLNVGDNFYPGGIGVECGAYPASGACDNGQFASVFEAVYDGEHLQGKPWLGVLGNHDYGGIKYDAGWDLMIYRTYCSSDTVPNNRWVTPALYWKTNVQYADFSVDYFMLDSNYQDAHPPGVDYGHNICNTGKCLGPTCAVPGLESNASCAGFFGQMWQEGLKMLEEGLKSSTAEWHIVVTHYPGESIAAEPTFARISKQYGIDLIFTGHRHLQEFNVNATTPFIVSGGGGGITADTTPDINGNDDAYGFVDFTITRTNLTFAMHSHGGVEGKTIIRSSRTIYPRGPSAEASVDEALSQVVV
jgi:hypothetical protein